MRLSAVEGTGSGIVVVHGVDGYVKTVSVKDEVVYVVFFLRVRGPTGFTLCSSSGGSSGCKRQGESGGSFA